MVRLTDRSDITLMMFTMDVKQQYNNNNVKDKDRTGACLIQLHFNVQTTLAIIIVFVTKDFTVKLNLLLKET